MLTILQLHTTYTNEQVLMILLSRLYFNTAQKGEVQQFIHTNNIDWNRFYDMVSSHNVRSFVYNSIITEQLKVDTDFLSVLKNDSVTISIKNLHQQKFVHRLLEDFKSIGIKAIPHKGVVLANRYYTSTALRESVDIDFWVNKKDVKQLRQFFHEKNYQAKNDVDDVYLNYALFVLKEFSFKTPKDMMNVNCSVEVQWRLLEWYVGKSPDYLLFAEHANAMGLHPAFDFICVSMNHIVKEPLTRFKYLIDLACMIDSGKNKIDVTLVRGQIKKSGYDNLFDGAMQTVDNLLGVALYQNTSGSTATEILMHNVVAYPVVDSISPGNLAILKTHLVTQRSIVKKVTLVCRWMLYILLPNTEDMQTFQLPKYCLPLLFILRPVRLLGKLFTKKKQRQ